MNEILKIGQILHTESSQMPCQVEQFLAGGGQGEVYQANLGGQSVALKWYLPDTLRAAPYQRSRLEAAIESGAPNDRFLWPIDLVSEPGIDGFGYIMPLRKPNYKTLFDLFKKRINPNIRSLATVGFQLADSYLQIHSRGLCYCDISFGNIFFNPDSGDIAICDNDNVVTNGAAVGIAGTDFFMAPEIVMGQASPSTQTDRYSLAVLLFYILHMDHPLKGKKETKIRFYDEKPGTYQLYGSEALFIFDPDNRANEPIPGYHDNAIRFWQIYPQFLRDLFIKAFTDGISDPQNGRVYESEWRGAMVRLQDSIVYCPHCGQENFYDTDVIKQSGGKMNPCWSANCQKEIRLPPRMRIDKNIVMLNHDTKLFPHHINNPLFDFSHPIAEVSRHPTNPDLWGIKNLSHEKWVCTTAEGELKEIEPNRSVLMAAGTKINFGQAEGEIRV